MKKTLALSLCGFAAIIVLPGCTGLAGSLQALGNDPAIVSGSIMTPYGSSKFVRIGGNRQNQTVQVGTDGSVTITNNGAGTNAPQPVAIVSMPAAPAK